MKKQTINFKLVFFLSIFLFLLAGYASAEGCILHDDQSSCSASDAETAIEIDSNFVETVIQPGKSFRLVPYVRFSDDVLTVDGSKRVTMKGETLDYPGLKITITNKDVSGSLIDLNIDLNKISSIKLNAKTVNFQYIRSGSVSVLTNAGVVNGGNISTGPNPLDNEKGNAGNVVIGAKYIKMGDISATGYYGNGGNVWLGEDLPAISVGSISSGSTTSVFDPDCPMCVFGAAGKITIGTVRSIEVSGNIQSQGVVPQEVDISAVERIWITGLIETFSGCKQVASVCDYSNLCDEDPFAYPPRKFCSNYSPAGKVSLQANGKGPDRGIIVSGGIDASATSAHKYDNLRMNLNPLGVLELNTGMGLGGDILIDAPSGLAQVGRIRSVGFHSGANAVIIRGTWVETNGSVSSSNGPTATAGFCRDLWEICDSVNAFPGELNVNKGTSAGNIFIESTEINNEIKCDEACPIGQQCVVSLDNQGKEVHECLSKSIIDLGGIVDASGQYPFVPNGGNVKINSAYRIEPKRITINASGYSLNAVPGDTRPWYVIDDQYEDPVTGDLINAWDGGRSANNFCNAHVDREYYNSANYATDGLKGGDGGDITIEATILQWQAPIENNYLQLYADGGSGSRGGQSVRGGYCSTFGAAVNPVLPSFGSGGIGGEGGKGGYVKVNADNLHCCLNLVVHAQGGMGGASGDAITGGETGNAHLGTCNLDDWKNGIVPEPGEPGPAGDGGAGGDVFLSSLPSDSLVKSAEIWVKGGLGGQTGNISSLPYPWYCSNLGSNQARGSTFISQYKPLYNCFIAANDALAVCRGDACLKTFQRAAAECQYEGLVSVDENNDGVSGDPNCCQSTDCYSSQEFDRVCRYKVGITACSSLGFTNDEWTGRNIDQPNYKVDRNNPIVSGIVDIENNYLSGSDGANGGRSGKVTLAAPLDEKGTYQVDIEGGDAANGGYGQNSSKNMAGSGGNGGIGGDAGELQLTNLNILSFGDFKTSGGTGGDGGKKGIASIVDPGVSPTFPPQYNGRWFCPGTISPVHNTAYFWFYDDFCPQNAPFCCNKTDIDALIATGGGSCKERGTWKAQGGTAYSVGSYYIEFSPDANDGQGGRRGEDATQDNEKIKGIGIPGLGGPERCSEPQDTEMPDPWQHEEGNICFSELCASVPIAGSPECALGSNDCMGLHRACNGPVCSLMSGAGSDICDENCDGMHAGCFNNQCTLVSGEGTDECKIGDDEKCRIVHLTCVNESCQEVDGPGQNDCSAPGSDPNCEREKHLECVNESCQEVDGGGDDKCSLGNDNECKITHTKCDLITQSCTIVLGKGDSECARPQDCKKPTHLACVNESCQEVDGPGQNDCSVPGPDPNCEREKHLECVNESCQEVDGGGDDKCTNYTQCKSQTHLECDVQNQMCKIVNGEGNNSCNIPKDCETNDKPTVINTDVNIINECGKPWSVKFLWTFKDNDVGDFQSAFQIKVYNGSSLVHDSGKVPRASREYIPEPPNPFEFGKFYTWTIEVWDSKGLSSGVINGKPDVDLRNRAVVPWPDFSWSPKNPAKGEKVVFDRSNSKCSGGGCSYEWNFEKAYLDNKPDELLSGWLEENSIDLTDIHFAIETPRFVKLKSTDSKGQTCEKDKLVPGKPGVLPPTWQETPPF